MPLYNHPNFGDIQNYIFAKGVITSVDSENDTANVTVEGYQDGTDVVLFYHCEPDAEERSNGAIYGAAAAFSVDAEVIVMLEVAGAPVRIVGFVDGIKACGWHEDFSDMLCGKNHWIAHVEPSTDNLPDMSNPVNAKFFLGPMATERYYTTCEYKAGYWGQYNWNHEILPIPSFPANMPWGIIQTFELWEGQKYGAGGLDYDWVMIDSNSLVVDNIILEGGDGVITFQTSVGSKTIHQQEESEEACIEQWDETSPYVASAFYASSNKKVTKDGTTAKWIPGYRNQVDPETTEFKYANALVDSQWGEDRTTYTLSSGFSVNVPKLEMVSSDVGRVSFVFYYLAHTIVDEVEYSTAHVLRLYLWVDTDEYPPSPHPTLPDGDYNYLPTRVALYPKVPGAGEYFVGLEYLDYDVYDGGDLIGQAEWFTFGGPDVDNGLIVEIGLVAGGELLGSLYEYNDTINKWEIDYSYGPYSADVEISDIRIS